MTPYIFTFPVSGKVAEWRPLPVGIALDVEAANRGNATLLGPSLLMARIVKYDGKDGQPSPAEWRSWDREDFNALAEEIERQEGARSLMLRKKRVGEDLDAHLEAAAAEYQAALNQLGQKLAAVIEAARTLKSSRDPLG